MIWNPKENTLGNYITRGSFVVFLGKQDSAGKSLGGVTLSLPPRSSPQTTFGRSGCAAGQSRWDRQGWDCWDQQGWNPGAYRNTDHGRNQRVAGSQCNCPAEPAELSSGYTHIWEGRLSPKAAPTACSLRAFTSTGPGPFQGGVYIFNILEAYHLKSVCSLWISYQWLNWSSEFLTPGNQAQCRCPEGLEFLFPKHPVSTH